MSSLMPGGEAGGDESSAGYPGGYPGASGYSGAGGESPGGQVAAKPPRPSNFDAWTDEDYMSAAREHDPKVLDAIDFKVKSAPGDASVAVLLIGLLDLPPLPAAANPYGGAGGETSGYPGMPAGAMPAGAMPNPAGASIPGSGLGHGAAPERMQAPALAPPQASLEKKSNRPTETSVAHSLGAVDSISAMILEASVSYMPQGPAVGAIAGGAQGRMKGLPGHSAEGGSTPQGSTPPPGATPGANTGGLMPPGNAGGYPGANPSNGYPGASPGNGYPGGNPQDPNGSDRKSVV